MFNRLHVFMNVTLIAANEALAQATPPATPDSAAAPASKDDGSGASWLWINPWPSHTCRPDQVLDARTVTEYDGWHDRRTGSAPGQLMHCYFHLVNSHEIIADDVGVEIRDLSSARDFVLQAIEEIRGRRSKSAHPGRLAA